MNQINPKNITEARATIVGFAGDAPRTKTFDSGVSILELPIAVGKGYKKDGEWVSTGTDWYTLTAKADYAKENWPQVEKGTKVRVDDGHFEVREFAKKDGTSGYSLNISYGSLSVVAPPKPSDGFVPEDVSEGF